MKQIKIITTVLFCFFTIFIFGQKNGYQVEVRKVYSKKQRGFFRFKFYFHSCPGIGCCSQWRYSNRPFKNQSNRIIGWIYLRRYQL